MQTESKQTSRKGIDMKKPELHDFGITLEQYELAIQACKEDREDYKEEKKASRITLPIFIFAIRIIYMFCEIQKGNISRDRLFSVQGFSDEIFYFSIYFAVIPFIYEYIYFPYIAYNIGKMPEAERIVKYEQARVEYEKSIGNIAVPLVYPLQRNKLTKVIKENIFRIAFLLISALFVLFQQVNRQTVPDYVCENLASEIASNRKSTENRRAFKEFHCPKKMIEDAYSKRYYYRRKK
nr:MAG TPA: hypothetical protein [Caudoviricetes sp.]